MFLGYPDFGNLKLRPAVPNEYIIIVGDITIMGTRVFGAPTYSVIMGNHIVYKHEQ